MPQSPSQRSIWLRPVTAALFAGAVTAAVLAVVMPAQGTPNATIQQRVSALEKKVTALQRTNTTQQKANKSLNEAVAALVRCLVADAGAVPVGAFGGTTEGYMYRLANGQTVITSALDLLAQNEVQANSPWMVVTSAQCASAINQRGAPATRFAHRLPAR